MVAWLRAVSIRTKLLALVVCAVLPALGAVLYSGLQAERRAMSEAEARIGQIVLDLAARQEQITASTRQFLVTLSHVPAVRQLRAEESSDLFRQLLAANPIYSNILVTDVHGGVLASAQQTPDGMRLGELPHIVSALQTRSFAQGRYLTSRTTGLVVLPSGYPVRGAEGRVVGVLTAGVRMDHFDKVVERLDLPPGSTVFMADADGTRLFNRHFPDPRPDVYPPGQPIRGNVWRRIVTEPQGQSFQDMGADGQPRLYTVRALTLSPEDPPYIHIGVSVLEREVSGAARAARNRTLLLLGVAALLASAGAWALGDRAFVRRIRRLAEVSVRFASGDLSARTGLPASGDELGRLAQAIDQIGEELSAREAERAETLARLSRTQFAVDHAGEEIYWADENGRLLYVNERACKNLGYTREELLGMTVFDVDPHMPREEWATVLHLLATSGPSVFETAHRAKDGRVTPKELSVSLMEVDGVPLVCGAAHDISGRKRYEALLRSLVEGTGAVTGAAFFEALATQMVRLLGVHAAFVCEYLPHDAGLVRLHALHLDGQSLPPRDCPVGPPPCAGPESGGICHCAGDTGQRFPVLPELEGKGIRSCLSVELADAAGHAMGLLGILDVKPLPPDLTLPDTLRLFALRASAEMERLAGERAVLASLREKEIMLREIHHRVKNNLQIISSLLSLQARNTADAATLDLLAESRSRILSMALVHEDLYQSDNFTRVDFRRYLGRLVDRIAGAVPGAAGVEFQLELGEMALPIDKAIPLGLATNEMLTNAVKHAFTDRQSGLVRVRLRTEEGVGVLTVQDDGRGLPDDFRPGGSATLGMQLIWSLTEQLRGDVMAHNDGGAVFTLRFPLG